MRLNLIIFISVFFIIDAFAQQDIMTASRFENISLINPAYKPQHGRASYFLQHRSQWVGFEGNPTTSVISYNSKTILRVYNYGLAFINDKLGPSNNIKLQGNFAYTLDFKKRKPGPRKINGKLVIGVKPGVNIYSNNFSTIKLNNPNDEAYYSDRTRAITPNFGVGIFYHTIQYYIGLSTTNMIPRKTSFTQIQNHYYAIAGGSFRFNRDERMLFEPDAILRFTYGAPIQLDLDLNLKLQYKYIVGLLFRTGGAIGVNLGAEVLNNFYLIYSFGFSYSNTSIINNNGNHEIMLKYVVPGFNIRKTKRRHRIGKGNRM